MVTLIRTDASVQIGSGHVMRCLTLAEALSSRGDDVVFVCREHPGNLIDRIRAAGYKVLSLPYSASMIAEQYPDEYARWLVVDQKIDAVETLAALQAEGIEARRLIVDHYGLDHLWGGHLRPHCESIIVIDDLANRRHDCHALLDQNYHDRMDRRYDGLVPQGCRMMLGPEYALLRAEFREASRSNRADTARPHIFVYFGAVDPTGDTLKTIAALEALPEKTWSADVVVGRSNPNRNEVLDRASRLGGITIHTEVRDMSGLMAKADFAVGAGGTTTWERCCLGLPTVIVAVAENQIPIAQSVDRFGAATFLGHSSAVSIDDVREAVERMAGDSAMRIQMAGRCRKLVDGHGAERVVDILAERNRAQEVSA
jgi:UDP-2,4-diacetamido-2,4,6-trideoxy-beta-L-altropyranose hydrolase